MPVPKFDALMLPLLKLANDGKEHRLNEAIQPLADELGLSDADRSEQIPSGQSRFRNRIYWAKLYLSQADGLAKKAPNATILNGCLNNRSEQWPVLGLCLVWPDHRVERIGVERDRQSARIARLMRG